MVTIRQLSDEAINEFKAAYLNSLAKFSNEEAQEIALRFLRLLKALQ